MHTINKNSAYFKVRYKYPNSEHDTFC